MNGEVAERIKDLALAAVLALVGIGGFLFINPTGADYSAGPGGLTWRTLPFIYSGLLLFLVGLFAASTLYDLFLIRRGETARSLLGERPRVTGTFVSDSRRVATLVCLVAYAAALKPFGFAIATPVLLFAMLRVLGRRRYGQNLALAVIGGLLLWILFVGVLKLPMRGDFWDPLTPALNSLYAMTGAR
ncbi:MAG: tripartite tricarboxylate transporter TctB family protein [Pseudomonadota bacterium]